MGLLVSRPTKRDQYSVVRTVVLVAATREEAVWERARLHHWAVEDQIFYSVNTIT